MIMHAYGGAWSVVSGSYGIVDILVLIVYV